MKNGSSGDDENEEQGAPDPFDPRRLRIGQRFGDRQDVRRIIVSVPVRKPGRQEFFRTHPDIEMWLETTVLEVKAVGSAIS